MFKKTLIVAALALAATGSYAQVYMQGAAGRGTMSVDCGTNTCIKSNPGNKFVIGYETGSGLSYEAQYINYGKITSSAFQDVKGSGYGGNVAYMGNFSNDQFGYRVAGGLARNKVENPSVSTTPTTSWQAAVGAGLIYNFNKGVALTADYDLTTGKLAQTATTTTTASMSLLSVGLRIKF